VITTFALPLRLHRYLSVAVQLVIVAGANAAAFALRFDANPPAWAFTAWLEMLPALLLVRALTFRWCGLYKDIWGYTGFYDVVAILKAVTLSSVIFVALASSPLGPPAYPRSVFIIDAIVVAAALAGVRMSRHVLAELAAPWQRRDASAQSGAKRLLIIGAGAVGEMLVREMRLRPDYGYEPVGLVSDDETGVGHRIHGVPVLGSRRDLGRILSAHRPHEILIAIPDADPAVLRSIVQALEHHDIPLKTLPRLRHLIEGTFELRHIRSLGFEDLLARAPVGLDKAPLRRLIAGRRVLVTGAGGSIGGELCRQIAAMAPAACIMLDRNENGLHALLLELRDRHNGTTLEPVIADVTDAARIDAVFARYRPEIIFHAAAHKHVPMMEANPCEAIKNNVTGTAIVADAAEKHLADRFIMISTDKAVNPSSMMGASKRLAELVVRAHSARSETTFATVRFGNVLGSSGSVVPLFLEQIRRGGPVTVTHPEVRRFFMLIPEAVQLVLHAAAQAGGAATYVLEMGEQVKLLDMARHLIRVSGHVPDRDIAIKFIGLRPGEKICEELVGDRETVRPSSVDKILRVTEPERPSDATLRIIAAIQNVARENDTAAVRMLLGRLLPAFERANADRHADRPVPVETPQTVDAAAVSEPATAGAGHICHVCESGRLRRTRARTFLERVTRSVGDKRLFACDGCGWRGRRLPLDFGRASLETPEQTPDLQEIDALVSTIPLLREWTTASRPLR
jgi:FlaA1/EpsC-like NDP-sugar epimerase